MPFNSAPWVRATDRTGLTPANHEDDDGFQTLSTLMAKVLLAPVLTSEQLPCQLFTPASSRYQSSSSIL